MQNRARSRVATFPETKQTPQSPNTQLPTAHDILWEVVKCAMPRHSELVTANVVDLLL